LLWWPSLTKDMQTEQLLCWSGMADTEHSTISGSNDEVEDVCDNRLTSFRCKLIVVTLH